MSATSWRLTSAGLDGFGMREGRSIRGSGDFVFCWESRKAAFWVWGGFLKALLRVSGIWEMAPIRSLGKAGGIADWYERTNGVEVQAFGGSFGEVSIRVSWSAELSQANSS